MKNFIALDRRLERRRRIDKNGCWNWTGCSSDGYGRMTITSDGVARRKTVHRVAYEYYVGPIPAGLIIDHLCRNRLCFNPEHLEPVTPRENVMRSPIAPAALNAAKTHCLRGHKYTKANTYRYGPDKRWRLCRMCILVRLVGEQDLLIGDAS